MDITKRKYRIVPCIYGNRAKAFKLQHKTIFGWADTKFGNGKVKEVEKSNLVGLIHHLKQEITEID